MRNIYSTILLVLISTSTIFACSCSWNGGFISTSRHTDLVIHGKVSKVNSYSYLESNDSNTNINSIEVKIIQKLKGQHDINANVIILGSRGTGGSDCRPYLNEIEIGSEWVFSLYNIGENQYKLSVCGEFIMPVDNNITTGFITYSDICIQKDIQQFSLDTLAKMILNPLDYIDPKRDCTEENEIYLWVQNMPKVKEAESIISYVKQNLKIKKIKKHQLDDKIIYELIVDKYGNLTFIKNKYTYPSSKRTTKQYTNAILDILKSAKWISGNHNNKNLNVKGIIVIKIKDLI